MQGRRGLDDMLRRVREQREEIRRRGRLDGILEQARALLDTAIGQERAELFPDPSDDARMREDELDALPADTAQAIRRLADYQWRSDAARQTFEQLKELLRREVLDSQFRGMKEALANPDPEALQRDELAGLMDQALSDAGLAAEMARLADALRARRPEIDMAGWQQESMTGDAPLGLGDATTAVADLADLADLEAALGQDYPGARLDDIDEESIRRSLGRQAVDDMEALRQIERELERQGYLQRTAGKLELTPKAVRRLGETALRQIFADLPEGRLGDHDQRDAGQAGEYTGATRPWQFGDEQAIDTPATVRNALLRDSAAVRDRIPGRPGAGPVAAAADARAPLVRLAPEDFGGGETERRGAAAVCLLVDLSYSMALRGTWGVAKQTALALHALVRSRFPQDAVQVIGFSNYARELRETDLAGLGWDMVQGTNLHHALVLAGRFLDQRPEHDPVVLIVTDGEPTAHLRRDGQYWFDWPPAPETLELTLAEVDKMTRRRAPLNIFMLADDEGLTAFVEEVAKRNGGRVLHAQPERLGEFVVKDFLRTRRAHRR